MKRARSPSLQVLRSKAIPTPLLAEWRLMHNSILALLPSADLVRRSLVSVAGRKPCLKVAAFDLDDTLVVPKSGAVFPRDEPTDWKWLLPSVPVYLRLLYDEGFMVVVVSNQSGIGGGKGWNAKKADSIKQKIIAMSEALEIPLAALVSTKDDVWRKPNVGLWTLLQDHASAVVNEKLELPSETPEYVFYVGDAAGRKIVTLAGRKKDFSCSDRKFAFNLKVPFLTPEQLYNCPQTELLEKDCRSNQKGAGKVISSRLLSSAASSSLCEEVDWDGLGPSELQRLPSSYDNLTLSCIDAAGVRRSFRTTSPASFHRATQEMIIFVGRPGCGKTTFFHRLLGSAGYAHINRDTLKTKEKCLAEAKKLWDSGRSVVIDNTNPSHGDCMQFISLVRQSFPKLSPLPVRLFVFTASRGLAMHMSNVRARLGVSSRINRIAYNVFQSKHEVWTAASVVAANIEELIEIPPVACFDGLQENTQREFFLLS